MSKLPFEISSRTNLDSFSREDYNPKPTARDREKFEAAKSAANFLPALNISRLHFKFDRDLTGNQLADALRLGLKDQGIDPDQVLIRYFQKNRLQYAIGAGSDRDSSSNVGYHGSHDGEEEWMRGLGIWGNQSVTFAAPIGKNLMGGVDAPKSHDYAYVIYDKRQLYKVGYASNGFHAFLTVPFRACVGFISEHGDIQLKNSVQPFQKPPSPEGP